MGNWFTYEFQVKHFKCQDCSPAQFYTSQWEINIWIFCAYKCLCFLYWLGWIVGAVLFHEGKPSYLFYLTTWGAWTIMLYFGMSFAICIHRMATRNSLTDDAEEKFISTTTIEKCETSQDYNISEQRLRWFHILNWILHTVAFDIALLVTILFWALLSTPFTADAVTVNNHTLNCIVMVFDLFVSNIPERLLHVVHSFTFTIVYATFLVLLHSSGINSSVYPVTNWSTNPWLAAGMCIGAAAATVFLRCIAFGLFKLRVFIASKTVNTDCFIAGKFEKTGKFQMNPAVQEDHEV